MQSHPSSLLPIAWGLVVKDALRKVKESGNNSGYHALFETTRGIIFLGTPHYGSSYASYGRYVAKVVRLVSWDVNLSLLRSIKQNSGILDRISEDFRITVTRGNLRLCLFVEELPMSYGLEVGILFASHFSPRTRTNIVIAGRFAVSWSHLYSRRGQTNYLCKPSGYVQIQTCKVFGSYTNRKSTN